MCVELMTSVEEWGIDACIYQNNSNKSNKVFTIGIGNRQAGRQAIPYKHIVLVFEIKNKISL